MTEYKIWTTYFGVFFKYSTIIKLIILFAMMSDRSDVWLLEAVLRLLHGLNL
jgi:hypothetical protein